MGRNPMPRPDEEISSSGKKKQNNTGGKSNTGTQPTQTAMVVTNTTPSTKNNYVEDVPKPKTGKSYSSKSTWDALYVEPSYTGPSQSREIVFDSVPVPQTQLKTTKPQMQTNYGNTEPKTNTTKQNKTQQISYTGQSITNTAMQSVKQTSIQNTTPQYSTKDRVDNAWGTASAETTKTDWNKLFGINKNTDYLGYPKSIKDSAEPKVNTAKTPEVNYGINREIAETTPKVDNSKRQIYIEYLKKGLSDGVGISNETAQSNFLDHRDQNPVEKFIERNPFDTVQETQYVTKDNVYEQTPEKIKTELTNTGTLVNNEISDLKRQREDLLFEVQYGRRSSSDPKLEKVNYDIEYLQHIENKIKMGLQYNYAFETEDLDSLSKMSVDDILNSKEEFNQNLPYLSPWAKAVRTAGKGVSAYQNSVGVVDNIGVKCKVKTNSFEIFDKSNLENSFEFSVKQNFNPKGYYEYIITPGENAYKNAEYIQYDLLKAIDGKTVSEESIEKLKKIANNDSKTTDKALDIVGYAIDFVDFWIVMESDKKFNDGQVGVDTYKAGGELIGSIAGDKLGAMAGAKAGAAIGTVALGPIGTVIGSVLGAAAGAYLLSNVMGEIGSYMVVEFYEYQPADPIQQYYERTK